MNVQIFFAMVIAAGFVACLEAKCCKRKGDILCCGNGKCDISCCDCDGGCNTQCQLTSCNPWEWTECAAGMAACAAVCVDFESEECVECLGDLYDICKKCFSRDVDTNKALNDTKYMLGAYYKENLRYNVNIGKILQAAEEHPPKKKTEL